MASSDSEPALRMTAAAALKIAVVGPVGVGKTTLVTSVSEIRPLTTEEYMTGDDERDHARSRAAGKESTTVAMDFGRISLNDRLVLYLFGTPGQERFWFLWDGLVNGALGAVVLVDVRRLEESFDVLERLEKRGAAFMVAANCFPGAPVHPVPELRAALDLPEVVPVVYCDARERDSCREVLLTLARYLLELAEAGPVAAVDSVDSVDSGEEVGHEERRAALSPLPHAAAPVPPGSPATG